MAGAVLAGSVSASAATEDAAGSFKLATSANGSLAVTDQKLIGPYVQQSFTGDFTTGTDLYFTQVYDKTTGDIVVTRTDLAGHAVVGQYMILHGAGHGRGIGLYHAPGGPLEIISEAWAVQDSSTGKWFGTRLALTPWSAGGRVDLSMNSAVPVGGRLFDVPQCVAHVSPSVDEGSNEIGVSCGANDGSRHWYVWDLDKFVAGTVDYAHAPIAGTWPTQRATGNGWALWGHYVYELEGDKYTSSNPYVGNTTLKSLDINGAWQEQWTTISDVADDNTYGYVEPEGVGVIPDGTGAAHLAYGLAANNNVVGSSTSIGYHPANVVMKPREFLAPPTPPATPANVTASPGVTYVDLGWGSVPGAAGYVVYRRTVTGQAALLVTVGSVTSYRDAAVTAGTTYYYSVAAKNSVGTSPPSSEVSAVPVASAPTAPRNLSVAAGKPGTKTLTLTWAAPTSNGGSAVTSYSVYRGTAAGKEASVAVATVGGSTLTYKDTAVTKGVRYYYRVTATNGVGPSPYSNEANGLPR
jgi:hypothetical protein